MVSDIKPEHIHILKILALKGGTQRYINMSSSNLAKIIMISQQTASRKIIYLLNNGFLERQRIHSRAFLRITTKGLDILKREAVDYQKIFNTNKQFEIEGIITSGLGEGKYYLSQKEYIKEFKDKLGFTPYQGTLNVKLHPDNIEKIYVLKSCMGVTIKGFKDKNRTFGEVTAFFCLINDLDGAVVLPKRTHYKDIIEIVSKHNLRKKFTLKDGDTVKLTIFL